MKWWYKFLFAPVAVVSPAISVNAAASWFVVDTMQTNCYNTSGGITAPASGQPYCGQDAQFYGNQSGYTLSWENKTVFDKNTGLTWMRGPNTSLAHPTDSDKMSWVAATSWPATLNAASYGGFSDWRLPTIKELYSLFECVGTDPSSYQGTNASVLTPFIDTNYFNFGYSQTAFKNSQYWSATTFIFNPSESGYQKNFGVNFADGRIKGYDLTDSKSGLLFKSYVQLVRGPTGYGINAFTNNNDGTITDLGTGLLWSRGDGGTPMTWSNALAWVQSKNASNYLGHGDWRMPNVKELQSLVNYSNAPDYNGLPAIDTNYFTCTAITNEAGQPDWGYYWTSSTHWTYSLNNTGAGEADYIAFGRALGWPSSNPKWVDVHGAGAQRSDPKTGPPFGYATVYYVTNSGVIYSGYSFGPQGDAIRGLNFVRLVRAGNYSSVDHVGDGIPDGWRRQYFGGSGTATNATSAADGDPDHDGASNYAEYLADTNPTNASSYFRIQSLSNTAGFKLCYLSSASRKYSLYSKTNLTAGAWNALPAQTNITGSGGVDSLSDTNIISAQRFYRVGVALP